ncbi:MAG: LysE family translocator [Rhodobacteraceae bacterium]|nr:LysE family translocator [Paracoccaceae bacterium]
MTLDQWLLFVGVWFAAGLPLGPNALNCIAISAQQGLGRALWAVAGILMAAALYIILVTAGLGALLLANAALFTALKLAGAAYLIWMGVKLLRSPGPDLEQQGAVADSPIATCRQSMLISLSNPKAIIAYGAVFSQFISPAQPLLTQLAALAPTALAIVAIIYIGYSALGLGVRRLLSNASRRRWFNHGVGGFYIFAGAALASSEISSMRTAR